VVRTDVGKRTMDEILRIVGDMRLAEAHELAAATEQWQGDFQVSRWVSAAGVILNIGLVLLATRLVYGDMRRRARQAINLRDQKQELEREVDERTRELTALSTHLQGVSEQEKSACWWRPGWIYPGFSSGCPPAIRPSNSASSASTNR
jgi:C4-dicarboxylate-specific signal transduction histidine kinase